jgi:hypothetical protein
MRRTPSALRSTPQMPSERRAAEQRGARGGGGCSVAEGARLEDWIGEMVAVNILREPLTTSDLEEAIVTITGFLRGVDPSGIILHFYPADVPGDLGSDLAALEEEPTRYKPRYAFYPWRRITLISRPDEAEE